MPAPLAGAGIALLFTFRAASTSGVRVGRIAVVLLGLCNASFAAEQIEFLGRTASLVPRWVPGGGEFWALATTVAFGLAAIAMVFNVRPRLAARSAALMLALFGILIWIPALIVAPQNHMNWSEGLETFVIAAAEWLAANSLKARTARASTTG